MTPWKQCIWTSRCLNFIMFMYQRKSFPVRHFSWQSFYTPLRHKLSVALTFFKCHFALSQLSATRVRNSSSCTLLTLHQMFNPRLTCLHLFVSSHTYATNAGICNLHRLTHHTQELCSHNVALGLLYNSSFGPWKNLSLKPWHTIVIQSTVTNTKVKDQK